MPYAVAAAAVAAGGAIYSADQAKSSQNAATDRAIKASQDQATVGRADLEPYRTAGSQALSRLQSLLGLAQDKSQFKTGYSNTLTPVDVANFDAEGYLKANPDVAADANYGKDPLKHYKEHGQAEGRQTYAPTYDTAAMDSANSSGNGFGSLLRKFSSDDLAADPVYNSGLQFGIDEGTKAIARKAAAGGGYDSGAEDKAIARFANDYGSTKAADSYSRFTNDQNNQFGRLSGIAGMGQGSTSVGVGAGANNASNLASLYSGQGNANAAASIAGGNAIGTGANSAANYYQQQQLLQQLSGGGQRTTTNPNYSQADLLAG